MGRNRDPLSLPIVGPRSHSVRLAKMDFKPLTFDQASALHGIPPAVLNATSETTEKWGNTFSYRSSGPIPQGLYMRPGDPKAIDMHVKSSNWGFAEGFAVVDGDHLGRIEKNGSIRKHAKDELPHDEKGDVSLNTYTLEVTLHDIMNDLNKSPPKYKILDSDEMIKESGMLRVVQVSTNPHVKDVVFSINLTEAKKSEQTLDRAQVETSLFAVATKPQWQREGYQPEWWNKEKWGEFKTTLENRFPSYYSIQENGVVSEPQPLKVFGKELVVVRDCDPHIISKPDDLSKNLDLSKLPLGFNIHKEIDTGTIPGAREMVKALLAISAAEKNPTLPKLTIRNMLGVIPNIVDMGTCTPFEVYQMMEVNFRVSQSITHISKFIKHGAEARNHAHVQPDGASIVIHAAHFYGADNNQGLSKLLTTNKQFVEETFDPNPAWPKEEWSALVTKQQNAGKKMEESVVKAFVSDKVESKEELIHSPIGHKR